MVGIPATGIAITERLKAKGLTITSWWRTPADNLRLHNDYLAGRRSTDVPILDWHMFGLAWDLLPATAETIKIVTEMGLHYLNEGTHIHTQLFPAGMLTSLTQALKLGWSEEKNA